MIEPDDREQMYHEVIEILRIDSELVSHYWTQLVNTFSMLETGEVIPICKDCNTSNVTPIEKKFVCENNLNIEYDVDGKPKNVNLIGKPHNIIFETQSQTVKRMVNEVLDMLTELGGYKPTLFQVENYIFMQPMDVFFETKHGEISKSRIVEKLSYIQDFITERLTDLRSEIRFTFNTPLGKRR